MAEERPKLVVGIVVDQMRWDYLERFADRFGEGGFRRMLTEGYSCDNTLIDYIPTVTAIGHTSIYTGSVPSIHGIAGNNFRDNGRWVYCTDDETVKPVGSTSKAGLMSPSRLLTTTVGDELHLATNFRSRVIAVALKDRAAILPGGRTADGAYWFDDETGRFITSSYYRDTPVQETRLRGNPHHTIRQHAYPRSRQGRNRGRAAWPSRRHGFSGRQPVEHGLHRPPVRSQRYRS